MGLFNRFAGFWKQRSTSNNSSPAQWLIDWANGGQKSAAGIVVSQTEALRDVITMACVSIRAGDIAKLPVHVMRRQKNGGSVILKSHPVERLLRKPNDWQTKFEFFEQMQAGYLLTNEAFAPILWNGRGDPVALIPINPNRASLYEAPGGDLFWFVSRGSQHEISELASFPQLISSEDMLHLRGMSLNGLTGLSRIGLGRDAIGLSLALERYSSALFARGARPGGNFQTDKRLADPTFKRLQKQLTDRHEGLENAGRSMILEEGLKWQAQQMTAVESQTVEARRLQIEQIATLFDVPLHRLGVIPDGGGDSILQAHQMYLNNTLSTDVERWENKLNDMFGLDGDETYVSFDLDYFNRADIQTRLTALGTAVTRSIYTVNEARAKEGLPADPKGNIIFQPANMVPLGTAPVQNTPKPAGPGSDTTGAPADGGDGDPSAVPTAD